MPSWNQHRQVSHVRTQVDIPQGHEEFAGQFLTYHVWTKTVQVSETWADDWIFISKRWASTLACTMSSVMPQQLLQSCVSPFPFQTGTTNPLFQSGERTPDCYTADSTTCMAVPLAQSISTLILQTPAAFPPINFFIAPFPFAKTGGVSFIGESAAAICKQARRSCTLLGSA